ncbi:phage tail protein [Lewinellaceae bacterium SD302]|nr:phage tail protein [Lewinellaceae bacterium SD302]
MDEGMIGEIRLFGGNFAPRNWALCNGALLAISSNDALFSILGTIYGGDGRTTFALPDLRGRVAVQAGHGPGLSDIRLGQKFGAEDNYLNQTNLPSHNHTAVVTGDLKIQASAEEGTVELPMGAHPASTGNDFYASSASPGEFLGSINLTGVPVNSSPTGNSRQLNNMMPSRGMNYIICMYGTYPSRS